MQSTDIRKAIDDILKDPSTGDVIILYSANDRDYFMSSHTDKKVIFNKLLNAAETYKDLIEDVKR